MDTFNLNKHLDYQEEEMILALEEFKKTQDQMDNNGCLQHKETFEKLRKERSKPEHKLS